MSIPLRAGVVPNGWRRLYILIGFRPASSTAALNASRIGRSDTGESRVSSLTKTKSRSPVAYRLLLRRDRAVASRGVIGIASESDVLVVSISLRTQLS